MNEVDAARYRKLISMRAEAKDNLRIAQAELETIEIELYQLAKRDEKSLSGLQIGDELIATPAFMGIIAESRRIHGGGFDRWDMDSDYYIYRISFGANGWDCSIRARGKGVAIHIPLDIIQEMRQCWIKLHGE